MIAMSNCRAISLKKSTFLRVIEAYPIDYVNTNINSFIKEKFCMIRDSISIYSNYQ